VNEVMEKFKLNRYLVLLALMFQASILQKISAIKFKRNLAS